MLAESPPGTRCSMRILSSSFWEITVLETCSNGSTFITADVLFQMGLPRIRLFSSLRILSFVKLSSIVRGHLEMLELALKK